VRAGIFVAMIATSPRGRRSRLLGFAWFVIAGSPVLALAQGPAAKPAAEVTVKGERPPLSNSQRAPSAASTVIQGPTLRQAGLTSADVMARIPGVQTSRSGAEADLATASIRGADSRQTPVYLAGIRLNDDVSGTADLSTIPLWMMERVEVFRGNAPEQADRLGLGGAVFFQPRMPSKLRSGAALELGSYGERGARIAHENGGAHAAALVSVRRWQADNDYPYTNDFGRRFDRQDVVQHRVNADFVAHDAWAIGRYRLGPGAQLTTVLNAFSRDQGVSGLSVVPAENSRSSIKRLLAGVSGQAPCSRASQDCTFEINTSLLAATTTLTDPSGEILGVNGPMLENEGRRWTVVAGIASGLGAGAVLRLRTGQAFESLGINRPSVQSQHNKRISSLASAVLDWEATPRVSFHNLVAMECHATEARNSDTAEPAERSNLCAALEPSARMGTRWRVSDELSVLGNLGRYVRVPTLGELYGVSPSVIGNSTLGAERGYSADAGVRGSWSLNQRRTVQLSVDGFAFSRWVSEMIRYQRVNTGALAPFNVASARILGTELAAALDWRGHLRAEAALTALDPRETTNDPVSDPTTNDVLPLTSRFVASSFVEAYRESESKALRRVALGIRHLHRSARFEDPAGLTVLPAQDFFDLETSFEFFGGALALRAALKNIFDSRTLDLIGLPLPGRTFHVLTEVWL